MPTFMYTWMPCAMYSCTQIFLKGHLHSYFLRQVTPSYRWIRFWRWLAFLKLSGLPIVAIGWWRFEKSTDGAVDVDSVWHGSGPARRRTRMESETETYIAVPLAFVRVMSCSTVLYCGRAEALAPTCLEWCDHIVPYGRRRPQLWFRGFNATTLTSLMVDGFLSLRLDLTRVFVCIVIVSYVSLRVSLRVVKPRNHFGHW